MEDLATFEPAVRRVGEGKTQQRHIFGDLEQLAPARELWAKDERGDPTEALKKAGVDDVSEHLRFLQGCHWDPKKAADDLHRFAAWRTACRDRPEKFPEVLVPLEPAKGGAYVCGRDKQRRPVVVFKVKDMLDFEPQVAIGKVLWIMDHLKE